MDLTSQLNWLSEFRNADTLKRSITSYLGYLIYLFVYLLPYLQSVPCTAVYFHGTYRGAKSLIPTNTI